jgi:hypothetical protein
MDRNVMVTHEATANSSEKIVARNENAKELVSDVESGYVFVLQKQKFCSYDIGFHHKSNRTNYSVLNTETKRQA